MGFFDSDLGRVAAGWSTGGLSEVYRAMRPKGSSQGYSALPFESPDNPVDAIRVSQALQQGLGRVPTQNEIDQYSKYVKTGDLDYGEISQIAQGLPEADKARLEQYATQFGDKLNAQNGAIIDQAANAASSKFASLGRPNTSAMGASVLQAGGQLAQQRQSALADFYGRGLGNNMLAFRGQGQDALNRAQSLGDSRTAYNRGLSGYQTQRNDYGTDLYNQELKNKRQAYNQFGGSLIGAGIGGALGGTGGARLGAGIGGQAGGLFQY